MKVIGAGLLRTGTLSTQAALQRLGYPCHHMTETPKVDGHLDAWYGLVSGKAPMDWHAIFANYEATVDIPACFYYEEIMRAFPEAKVLLNLRDPDKWFDSFFALYTMLEQFRPLAPTNPKLREFYSVGDALLGRAFNGELSRENCIRVFHAHNAEVQDRVPKDRLLVFRVQDGWEPLCEFLGHDVPDDPFPHINEGVDTIQAWAQRVLLQS